MSELLEILDLPSRTDRDVFVKRARMESFLSSVEMKLPENKKDDILGRFAATPPFSAEEKQLAAEGIIIHEIAEAGALRSGMGRAEAHVVGMMAEAYHIPGDSPVKGALAPLFAARDARESLAGERKNIEDVFNGILDDLDNEKKAIMAEWPVKRHLPIRDFMRQADELVILMMEGFRSSGINAEFLGAEVQGINKTYKARVGGSEYIIKFIKHIAGMTSHMEFYAGKDMICSVDLRRAFQYIADGYPNAESYMITVSYNGDPISLEPGVSVEDILHKGNIPANAAEIVINGKSVARNRYSITRLVDGDELVIVSNLRYGRLGELAGLWAEGWPKMFEHGDLSGAPGERYKFFDIFTGSELRRHDTGLVAFGRQNGRDLIWSGQRVLTITEDIKSDVMYTNGCKFCTGCAFTGRKPDGTLIYGLFHKLPVFTDWDSPALPGKKQRTKQIRYIAETIKSYGVTDIECVFTVEKEEEIELIRSILEDAGIRVSETGKAVHGLRSSGVALTGDGAIAGIDDAGKEEPAGEPFIHVWGYEKRTSIPDAGIGADPVELDIVHRLMEGFGIDPGSLRWKHESGFDVVEIKVGSIAEYEKRYALLTAFDLPEYAQVDLDEYKLLLVAQGGIPVALSLSTRREASVIDLSFYYSSIGNDERLERMERMYKVFWEGKILERVNDSQAYLYASFDREGMVVDIDRDLPGDDGSTGKSRVIQIPVLPGVYRGLHPSSKISANAAAMFARSGMKVLVLGTGMGLEALMAAERGAEVHAVDRKNLAALNTALLWSIYGGGGSVSAFVNDLFDGLGEYDLILFNMPLPGYPDRARAITPYDRNLVDYGKVLLRRVAEGLHEHIAPGGRAVIVNRRADGDSEENGDDNVKRLLERHLVPEGFFVEAPAYLAAENSQGYLIRPVEQIRIERETAERISCAIRSIRHSNLSFLDLDGAVNSAYAGLDLMILWLAEKVYPGEGAIESFPERMVPDRLGKIAKDLLKNAKVFRGERDIFDTDSQKGMLSEEEIEKYIFVIRAYEKAVKAAKKEVEELLSGSESFFDSEQNRMKGLYEERMERLLGGLKSRLEIASGTCSGDMISPSGVVADVIGQVAGGRSCVKVEDGLPEDVFVAGNRFSFASAVANIVDNAVFFAEERKKEEGVEPEVTVTLALRGSGVSIEITDNGGGIPQELLEADPVMGRPGLFVLNTSRRKGGTGLGVTEAWYAIKDMGGTLEVSCSPDKAATTFAINVPAVQKERLFEKGFSEERSIKDPRSGAFRLLDERDVPACQGLASELILVNEVLAASLFPGDQVIVAIDTSWVPPEQRALESFAAMLSRLKDMPSRLGTDDVVVVYGDGPEILARRIEQAFKENDKLVKKSDILFIGKFDAGKNGVLFSGEYKRFEDLHHVEGVYFADLGPPACSPGRFYELNMPWVLKQALARYRAILRKGGERIFFLSLPGSGQDGLTIERLHERYAGMAYALKML